MGLATVFFLKDWSCLKLLQFLYVFTECFVLWWVFGIQLLDIAQVCGFLPDDRTAAHDSKHVSLLLEGASLGTHRWCTDKEGKCCHLEFYLHNNLKGVDPTALWCCHCYVLTLVLCSLQEGYLITYIYWSSYHLIVLISAC